MLLNIKCLRDREEQFAGEGNRKTKELRVGGRCPTVFVLPDFYV